VKKEKKLFGKKQYFFFSQKPTGKSNSSFLPEQSELTKKLDHSWSSTGGQHYKTQREEGCRQKNAI
jgi:hypothetical protein